MIWRTFAIPCGCGFAGIAPHPLLAVVPKRLAKSLPHPAKNIASASTLVIVNNRAVNDFLWHLFAGGGVEDAGIQGLPFFWTDGNASERQRSLIYDDKS